MENLLCIKGKIIGKGKPLVCVPVMESSKEEILRETRRLEEAHTEMSGVWMRLKTWKVRMRSAKY